MEIIHWADFKDFAVRYALTMFYVACDDSYRVCVVKNGIVFWCSLLKYSGGPEVIDFETNYKTSI